MKWGMDMTLPGKIISLNIAQPETLMHGSKEVESGINKKPAGKPLLLTYTGLTGDGQADLIHHGGPDKAVCVYSAVHFPYWEQQWKRAVEPGAFGENFTLSALTEESLCIGDIFRVGGALVQVSQPRQPCFKLGIKHGLPGLPQQVQQEGYTGFYFRVLEEGLVVEGDELHIEAKHPAAITVAEANHVMYKEKSNAESMRRMLAVQELSSSWRQTFESRLEKVMEERS